jgi:hypothetical protein
MTIRPTRVPPVCGHDGLPVVHDAFAEALQGIHPAFIKQRRAAHEIFPLPGEYVSKISRHRCILPSFAGKSP